MAAIKQGISLYSRLRHTKIIKKEREQEIVQARRSLRALNRLSGFSDTETETELKTFFQEL